jgi:hypothetical protein
MEGIVQVEDKVGHGLGGGPSLLLRCHSIAHSPPAQSNPAMIAVPFHHRRLHHTRSLGLHRLQAHTLHRLIPRPVCQYVLIFFIIIVFFVVGVRHAGLLAFEEDVAQERSKVTHG